MKEGVHKSHKSNEGFNKSPKKNGGFDQSPKNKEELNKSPKKLFTCETCGNYYKYRSSHEKICKPAATGTVSKDEKDTPIKDTCLNQNTSDTSTDAESPNVSIDGYLKNTTKLTNCKYCDKVLTKKYVKYHEQECKRKHMKQEIQTHQDKLPKQGDAEVSNDEAVDVVTSSGNTNNTAEGGNIKSLSFPTLTIVW